MTQREYPIIKEINELRAENERLRAALQEIAALAVPDYRATEIARRALEPKP